MILSNIDPGYRQCSLTVMDNIADPGISFDAEGVCNYVHEYRADVARGVFHGEDGRQKLDVILDKIRAAGKGNAYDCIVGVSGGVDSTYVALLAKTHGLRPLIVHFDNGWNSELAVKNIENIIKNLGFDLFTYVINWNEFRDIQRAYFKASVIDIEAITDHAILATVHRIAKEKKIRYILSGSNFVTEGILPGAWIHDKSDWLNIRSIHAKFGSLPLKTFPRLPFYKNIWYQVTGTLTSVNILNYIDYDKERAKAEIRDQLGWRDYGGKHHESVFTRFYQSYILPVKFHVDKRKAHLSTLICSGQMNREEALEELTKPIADPDLVRQDKEFVMKKLGFSEPEFDTMMRAPQVQHSAYPNYNALHWKYYFGFLARTRKLRSLFGK